MQVDPHFRLWALNANGNGLSISKRTAQGGWCAWTETSATFNLHNSNPATTVYKEIIIRNIYLRDASLAVGLADPAGSNVWATNYYTVPYGHDLRYRSLGKLWDVFRPEATALTVTNRDYPHQCTRCGAPAYVGAFEVTHADEAAASGCPARRK